MADSKETDLQDPLPESNFTWRRGFTIALVLVLLLFVYLFVGTIGDVATGARSETAISGLVGIVRLLIWLVALAVTYYMLAPSAEQLARIVQTAKLFREGGSLPAPTPAPPAPPVPIAPPAPAAPPPVAIEPPATPVIE